MRRSDPSRPDGNMNQVQRSIPPSTKRKRRFGPAAFAIGVTQNIADKRCGSGLLANYRFWIFTTISWLPGLLSPD